MVHVLFNSSELALVVIFHCFAGYILAAGQYLTPALHSNYDAVEMGKKKITSYFKSEASCSFPFASTCKACGRQLVPAWLTRVKDKQTAGFKADSSLLGQRTELCPGKTFLMLLKSQVSSRCSGIAAPCKHVFSLSPFFLWDSEKKKKKNIFMSAELLFFLLRANNQVGVRQTEQIPTGHLQAALVKLLALTTSLNWT